MSLSARKRNILIASVVALAIIAVLVLLLVRGCGGEEKTATTGAGDTARDS